MPAGRRSGKSIKPKFLDLGGQRPFASPPASTGAASQDYTSR
ncbi:hypothetical protein SAMCCGM7_pC0678 (plasmid) [Sinorhizobium americanum CCGM7]|nr:hypothetical protein SAMCCGM7_pC0678 [Sinorhizobium americanum CCGM7]